MYTDSEDSDFEEPAQACQDISRNNLEFRNAYSPFKGDIENVTKKKKMDCTESVSNRSKKDELKQNTNNFFEINKQSFKNFADFERKINESINLKYLKLNDCSIELMSHEVLPNIETITRIAFNNCDENMLKAFTKQESIQRIEVHNDDKIFKKFSHKIFNEICRNCKDLDHIVLKGAGTSSYFDSYEFPFKIKRLETTSITHNWFIGLKEERIKFLEEQKESLKHLTIHQLPYDFDGGKVLKFIFNEMDLETFYYGEIPLIISGKKQEVKEFEASEIQLTSAIEMLKQFPSIEKFTLKLSSNEISSDDIDKVLDSSATVFNNLKEFVVIDNSRGSLGVFLGIFVNLGSLKKLTLDTNNRFINTILACIPIMPNLEQIQLTSTAPKASARYEVIKILAPNLKIIKVLGNSVGEAQGVLGDRVASIDKADQPCSSKALRESERSKKRKNRSRDDDDDDNSDEDEHDGSDPLDDSSPGVIEEKNGTFSFYSPVQIENINSHSKLRVHVLGHPTHVVTQTNKRELRRLIKEEPFYGRLIYLTIEKGAFVIGFGGDLADNPNKFKTKIDELAYRLLSKGQQLPLMTITSSMRIMIYCYIKRNVNGELFVRQFSSQNGLNGSQWVYHNTVRMNDQFQLSFSVDAISFSLIQKRRYFLKFEEDQVQVRIA